MSRQCFVFKSRTCPGGHGLRFDFRAIFGDLDLDLDFDFDFDLEDISYFYFMQLNILIQKRKKKLGESQKMPIVRKSPRRSPELRKFFNAKQIQSLKTESRQVKRGTSSLQNLKRMIRRNLRSRSRSRSRSKTLYGGENVITSIVNYVLSFFGLGDTQQSDYATGAQQRLINSRRRGSI